MNARRQGAVVYWIAPMSRLFSREEADAMLPYVAPLLWQARELKQEHDQHAKRLEELQVQAKGNGHGIDVDVQRARAAQQQAAIGINALVAQVKEKDVEVKDVDLGLIDFRSEREGRVVYLCWKLGEERVDWWHELDTGYASRQRLD